MACHVSMTFSSLVIAQCGHGTVANTSHALKSTFCFKVGFTDARGTAQVVLYSRAQNSPCVPLPIVDNKVVGCWLGALRFDCMCSFVSLSRG